MVLIGDPKKILIISNNKDINMSFFYLFHLFYKFVYFTDFKDLITYLLIVL